MKNEPEKNKTKEVEEPEVIEEVTFDNDAEHEWEGRWFTGEGQWVEK